MPIYRGGIYTIKRIQQNDREQKQIRNRLEFDLNTYFIQQDKNNKSVSLEKYGLY